MATTTDEIIIKVSIAKEQAAVALKSIKANISNVGLTLKKIAAASLAFGASLSSVFAIARGGTLAFGFLNKIPGIALRGSKSLALIAGATQLVSKGATLAKVGVNKLNQALSSITGREISLAPEKLRQVGRAAISATQGVLLLKTGMSGLRSGFGPLGKIIGGITKRIFSMRSAFLVLAGVGGVLGLGNSLVSAASQMEDFSTRFIALTKSTDEAQKKISFLSKFAGTVPFELPSVINAGITLEAFGIKVREGMKPLADLAAFMGVDIKIAAAQMGKAFAAGAGAAEMLKERGVFNILKLRLGIEDLSKLTLPEFRKAMMEMLTDVTGRMAGSTDLLAKTLTGQTSMMTDAIFQLRVAFGEQLLPKIKELVEKRIVPLIKKMTEWVKVNKDLIALKFAQFIDDSVVKIQKFVEWAEKAAIESKRWWEANKELVFTLVKLAIAGEIAIKVSALVLAITGLGKVLISTKALLSGFLLKIAGAGGLFAAVSVLSPQILVLGGALALLLGLTIGSWASDWIFGLNDLKKEMKELSEESVKLNDRLSKKLATLGFPNIETFNEAIKKGLVKYNETLGVWEKIAKVFKTAGEAGTKAAKKIATAWGKASEKVKKAFEALGITPKIQFEDQVKDAVKAFETIANSGTLSDDQVVESRAKMFEKLRTLADQAEEGDVLGINIEDFKTSLSELEQDLISQTRGAILTLKDSTGQDVTEVFKEFQVGIKNANEVILEGFTKDSTTLAKETVDGINGLFEGTTTAQQTAFEKMTNEVERLANLHFDTETAITDNLKEETEARLRIIEDFTTRAIAEFARQQGAISAFGGAQIGPEGTLTGASESPLPFFVEDSFARGINRVPRNMIARIHKDEQIIPASQNPNNPSSQINDNRQNNMKLNFNFQGGGAPDNFETRQQITRAVGKALKLSASNSF